jgi:hypothetical protein
MRRSIYYEALVCGKKTFFYRYIHRHDFALFVSFHSLQVLMCTFLILYIVTEFFCFNMKVRLRSAEVHIIYFTVIIKTARGVLSKNTGNSNGHMLHG